MKHFLMMMLFTLNILSFTVISSATSSSSSASVIIIGAGMSGISAAKSLSDAGIKDFMILEATSRIGRRMYRTEFSGHTIELGANWLHAEGGRMINPLYEMAKQIKLKTFLSVYDNITSYTYKQGGGMYTKVDVEAAMREADKRKKFSEDFSKILASKKHDDDMSILAAQRLYQKVPRTPLEMAIDFFYYDYEFAEVPKVTSLKHTVPASEFFDFGEDAFFVADPRGFESLVHLIAKKFLKYNNTNQVQDSRLKLNKVVKSIRHSRGGVSVQTEDGSVYKAKAAILTVSVGVLQSNLIHFTPKLPVWKRRGIDEFSMAIFTKVFLKFPRKFWPTGSEFFLYAHQRRGYYPLWQHLEMEMPGSNILFVILCENESTRIEQQSDEATKTEAMEVLREMFGNEIPDPEAILVPRWESNRFYRGSFSNWPTGYVEKRHEQLKAPYGSLYFSGEHTHDRYFGYVTGACYAGNDTAHDVIKYLQDK